MEAYKFALTREFAVIQGPPGTGKTYIGVKIASTLLRNLSLEGTPMLIICYTNHALDQFLEGILHVTENIVRLGSQSKSPELEKYTLHKLRMKVKSKYSYLYAKKRSELEAIFKQTTEIQSEIEKCEKEIIAYKNLKPYLRIGEKNYELKSFKEDSILNWLFSHLEEDIENMESETEDVEDWKKLDDLTVTAEIETCFSEKWGLKEIESLLNSMKYVKNVTDDQTELEKMTDRFEMQIKRVRRRLNCWKVSRYYFVIDTTEQKLSKLLFSGNNLKDYFKKKFIINYILLTLILIIITSTTFDHYWLLPFLNKVGLAYCIVSIIFIFLDLFEI